MRPQKQDKRTSAKTIKRGPCYKYLVYLEQASMALSMAETALKD